MDARPAPAVGSPGTTSSPAAAHSDAAESPGSGLQQAGSSGATPPVLLAETDSFDSAADLPFDPVALTKQWNEAIWRGMGEGSLGAVFGDYMLDDFVFELSDPYGVIQTASSVREYKTTSLEELVDFYNWSMPVSYGEGVGLREPWASHLPLDRLTVRTRYIHDVLTATGEANRVDVGVRDVTFCSNSGKLAHLRQKVVSLPADATVLPGGPRSDQICFYVRMLFDCMVTSVSDGTFGAFAEAACTPDVHVDNICFWRDPPHETHHGRMGLWEFHNRKMQELQRLLPGEPILTSTWGDMCVVGPNTVRLERRHSVSVTGNYVLYGVQFQRGEVSEVCLAGGKIKRLRTYHFPTADLSPGADMPSWVHPPAWGERQHPAPAPEAVEAPAAAQAGPRIPTLLDTDAPPLLQPGVAHGDPAEDGSQAVAQQPAPCAHNSWDSLRIRKGQVALRCRECEASWRVQANWLADSRCAAFDADACAQHSCAAVHVHRIKRRSQNGTGRAQAPAAGSPSRDRRSAPEGPAS
eukprot:TRINITY_DN11931_c0_g1_i1.p1 TRINITY_DN11931_c0_g1~~TRINITY_DN11931_c0_g1_i1.p1  ORF type:complete len:523 (+),score=65.53 TRINITY_DN11931_c0_g1_i1:59-1627(+)